MHPWLLIMARYNYYLIEFFMGWGENLRLSTDRELISKCTDIFALLFKLENYFISFLEAYPESPDTGTDLKEKPPPPPTEYVSSTSR